MISYGLDLQKNKIILYGAGYAGLHFCDLLLQAGIKPAAFLDADKNKQGQFWQNIKILSPEQKSNVDKQALVIVCLLRKDALYDSIVERLNAAGFHRVIHMQQIQTADDFRFLFGSQNLILFAEKQKLNRNQDKIKYVRRFLERGGVKIYDQIISYIENDFQSPIDSLPLADQYWAYDLFNHNEDEVVFDCGAFDGTVMQEFIKRNSRFKKYYAFEPDRANADRINTDLNEEKIRVIPKALSDRHEKVCMRNYMNMNSVIIDHGDFYVETMCLDDMDILPTFIKIDVEGYEERVLRGAGKLLKKCRPVIACAMYHSLDQLWNVPIMIMEKTENYIYSVRSYMNLHETIFYAVPMERKR